MSQKTLSGSLALTKLHCSVVTTKKGNKCLLIPIEKNFLYEKDEAVYMAVNVIYKPDQDENKQNGFIAQKMSTEKYKELGAEAAKAVNLPILGSIKYFAGIQNDGVGATYVPGTIDPEDSDDLPF